MTKQTVVKVGISFQSLHAADRHEILVHIARVRGVNPPLSFEVVDLPMELRKAVIISGHTPSEPGWDANGGPAEEFPS